MLKAKANSGLQDERMLAAPSAFSSVPSGNTTDAFRSSFSAQGYGNIPLAAPSTFSAPGYGQIPVGTPLSNMLMPSAAPARVPISAPSAFENSNVARRRAPAARAPMSAPTPFGGQMMQQMRAPSVKSRLPLAATSAFGSVPGAPQIPAQPPVLYGAMSPRAAPSAFESPDASESEESSSESSAPSKRPLVRRSSMTLLAAPSTFDTQQDMIDLSKYKEDSLITRNGDNASRSWTQSQIDSDVFAMMSNLSEKPSYSAHLDPQILKTERATEENALAFQHATQFSHHKFLAAEVALTDAEMGSSEKQNEEVESVDDTDLKLRMSLAAHILAEWKDNCFIGFEQSVDLHTTVDFALKEAKPYVPGMAASLIQTATNITDEAGDTIIATSEGIQFALGSCDASDLSDGRDVRLFVSSTFKDMHGERDQLIRRVFPSLQSFCADRGIRLLPMDLRWGITEEQSKQGSTIEICLREVERARPYFLCMLGARYGWAQPLASDAPKDRLLQATVERAARQHPWLARYADRSITELEVRHGVLNAVAPELDEELTSDVADNARANDDAQEQPSADWIAERAMFFVREDTYIKNTSMDPRQIKLREQILNLGRTGKLKHVTKYSHDAIDSPSKSGVDSNGRLKGLSVMAKVAADRLRSILAKDFPLKEKPSPLAAEFAAHKALCARLSKGYVARPELYEVIEQVVKLENSKAEPFLAITAPAGMGKTALLANWLRRWRTKNGGGGIEMGAGSATTGPFVLAHFATASASSADLSATLLRLITELQRAFGLTDGIEKENNDQEGNLKSKESDWDGDDLPSASKFVGATGGGSGDDGGGGARLRNERLAAKFGEVLRAAAMRAGAGIVLLIDGAELLRAEPSDSLLQWLPKPLPRGVRALIGARTVPGRWRGACQQLQIPPLIPVHRALLCAQRLAIVGKTLSSRQLDTIAQALSTQSPLFVRIVSDELCLMGDFEGLSGKLNQYVSLSSTRELRSHVLRRIEKEFAAPPGRPSLLADVLATLLVVRDGLSESELLAAARCPPVTWSLLSTALDGALVRRGELMSLADEDVVAVANQLCSLQCREEARQRLQLHYKETVEREIKRLEEENISQKSRGTLHRVHQACAAPVPHSDLLVRALRQQLSLLMNSKQPQTQAIEEILMSGSHAHPFRTFEILWHAKGADGHAARYDLYKFWRYLSKEKNSNISANAMNVLGLHVRQALRQLQIAETRRTAIKDTDSKHRVSEDGFPLSLLDIVDDDRHDDELAINEAQQSVLLLFRVCSAMTRFVREAMSAEASLVAASFGVDLAKALRRGQQGAGRYTMAVSAKAYAARLAGKLPLAESLYREALSGAERLVGGGASAASVYGKNDSDDSGGTGTLDVRLAQLINALAITLRQQAKYPEAQRLYNRALAIRKSVLGDLHVDTAQSHNSLGCLHQDLGRYDESEYHLQLAISLREQLLGREHPDVAMSLTNLGGLRVSQGRLNDAVVHYERAKRIYQSAYGEMNAGVAQCINSLAGVASERRRDEEARRLYAQALRIRRAVQGADHPEVAVTLNDLAVMHVREGEHDKAEPLYRQALAIRKAKLGATHVDTAQSMANLGLLCQDLERYDEAKPLMESALQATKATLGASHVDVAGCLRNLAGLYQSIGKYNDAVTTYSEALKIYREKLGNLHIDVALTCNDQAVLYMRMGQPSAAESLYADALDAYIDHFGEQHHDVALATLNLAECVTTQALQRGDGLGALELCQKATKLFGIAKERFKCMRVGAVSGAGAVGVTREQRLAHCDLSIGRLNEMIQSKMNE